MASVENEHVQEPLPIQYLEARLDHWVNDFPLDAIQQQLRELEQRKGDIDAAIESLKRRLAVWQAMRAHSLGAPEGSVPKPSKRDAILNLLDREAARTFALAEMRDYLIANGFLEDDKKGRHALEMTVVNMVNRGEIERPRKGFYRVAADRGSRTGNEGYPPRQHSRGRIRAESPGAKGD